MSLLPGWCASLFCAKHDKLTTMSVQELLHLDNFREQIVTHSQTENPKES